MTALDDHDTARLPFHLRGSYAPVTEEVEAFDLPVQGRIPDGLNGVFVRNGPNPMNGRSPHWFAGDGMLHGVRLRDGKAEWYRNRWVRTRALEGATRVDPATGVFDLTVGLANTHVVRHAGRIFALEEASLPNEVTPGLDTIGPFDFGGALRTPFTAHPHVCPETGEMHFFGYELVHAPFVTYHVVDRDGALVHTQPIEVGGPTMVHDFAISRNYAIFLDLPVVFDLDMAMTGSMPFAWQPSYGARIGLLHRDRARQGAEPQWFDVSLCYVFHIMNAWDDGPDGRYVWLDGGRHARMWANGNDDFEPSLMHRWRFDLHTGEVKEEFLDDVDHAFPRIDDRRCGLANRFGWAVAPVEPGDERHEAATGLVKYDVQSGTRTTRSFGPTSLSGEPVFVPARDDAGEDEGYLVTFVHDVAADRSSFVVVDASDMTSEPLAVVPLPQRVPRGFHGSWFGDE
jgi:carotenoid cleavage dioxygenase